MIPKKIHPPFDFQENSSSFDFREKSIKTPKENQKKKKTFIFVAPCVFWICSRVLFDFVPLDLNFTNPKSTIFEPGWKTQALPANHDQIAPYVYYLFLKWTDFVFCAWTGRKYREIPRKIGKNTDKHRNIGDIQKNYRNFRRPIIGDEHRVVAGR